MRNALVIQRVPTAALHLPEVAILHHPKKQVEKAKEFLAAFGQVPPVLAAQSGEILSGEEIWLALKARGDTLVDVVYVNDKSPEELATIRIALQRIPQDSRWDNENVRLALENLASVDFDISLTGFDAPEIDFYLDPDLPKKNVEENGADIPQLDSVTVSAPGNIWKLGGHRVGCGSATDGDFVAGLLDGRIAKVCFVDPPYNVKVDGFITGKGRHRHREFVQGAGELSSDDFFSLLRDSLLVLKRSCAPTALIYACIDWRHVMEMTVAGHACEMALYTICVWTKTNGGMGGIYRNAHELICVFRAGNETPLDNVELGRNGRNRTNVWSHPGMSSFGKERDALLGSHPTTKPVAMIADALRDITKRGDVILDTFLGSGSTLMAAQETGRICYGVELDPRYVDVAVRRWQNTTGRDAVLVETGDTFDSMSQRLLAARGEQTSAAG